ncbi:MAG: hypothetical protein LBS12_04350 [Prevotellaceae bacterium]|jgi:nitroreductase|nr:hypothetical protein [Prevotellaceae bacterium]
MNFLAIVKLRQSNRAYEDKEVEREKIELVLEAGRLSPKAYSGWRDRAKVVLLRK